MQEEQLNSSPVKLKNVRVLSAKRAHKQGFTIVELLVVIVVIAILATISIIAYSGIQQRARESRVALQLTQLRKAMEIYKIEYGEWPFQASMDHNINEGQSPASAWCNAARSYISSNSADSGASPSVWSVSCSTRSSSTSEWSSCVGITAAHSWPHNRKTIYISSEKLGVSPPYPYGEDPEWCFE